MDCVRRLGILLCLFAVLVVSTNNNNIVNGDQTLVSYDGRGIILNGQRRILISGSIHYPRSTPQMWPDLIAKSKEGGLNVIETYVFWNLHEPQRRQYDFEGRLDLVKFLKTIQDAGLYVHLRIGPYVCAEWTYGGFPLWLRSVPGIYFRTDNEPFKYEMRTFVEKIVRLMKKEKLFSWQGGPIILAQIENEYGNVQKPYGKPGLAYMKWAANMAESLNTSTPWVMCQQSDAPKPILNACNGFYCDEFQPNSITTPKIWIENWSGWFQTFGDSGPHRPTEDLAFSVARFFQKGGSFQNYYMYHGGTNFGRTAGGPFITTSYDYDAPIDEYGLESQPKWGHLRDLHRILTSYEKVLTYGLIENMTFSKRQEATKYYMRETNECIAFLSNEDSKNDTTIEFNGNKYLVPAWSVTILSDCKNEEYNTAKINAQTSIMGMKTVGIKDLQVKDTNAAGKWSWYKENVGSAHAEGLKTGVFSANKLLEQISTAKDESDYLWYSTKFHVEEEELLDETPVLSVRTKGHGLYVYVNGEFAGARIGNYSKASFTFKNPISLKPGYNEIDMLSFTFGLPNYGSFFDTLKAGIEGPVKLMGLKNGDRDLSLDSWKYHVGLKGEHLQMHLQNEVGQVTWTLGMEPPKNIGLIWYKTEFSTPQGNNPVAVDLTSMGKGQAWVNGNHIGRYYTLKASKIGCSAICDYKGSYYASKCHSKCGQPSQTWYHVPRAWLNAQGNNVLVLLEELGGNPSAISFGTRHVEIVCGMISQDSVSSSNASDKVSTELMLQCSEGNRITAINFASFGNPSGSCGKFMKGSCHANNSLAMVENACIGKQTCSVAVRSFESSCGNDVKSLAVAATCSS